MTMTNEQKRALEFLPFVLRHSDVDISSYLTLLADASYRYDLTADDHRHAAPCAVVRIAR